MDAAFTFSNSIVSDIVSPMSSVDYDLNTMLWFQQVIARGGTVSLTRRRLVDALIVTLKSLGVWSKLDRLWLLANENTTAAAIDIIALTALTPIGAPVFTTDRGYASAGTGSYIRTNVDVSVVSGLNFQAASACDFAWSVDDAAVSGPIIAAEVNAFNDIYPAFTDGHLYWRINDQNGDVSPAPLNAHCQGLWCATNTGLNETLYRNGASFSTGTIVANVLPSGSITILTRVTGAAGDTFTANCACAGFGGFLTATDALNLYNTLRTYMTAIGVP